MAIFIGVLVGVPLVYALLLFVVSLISIRPPRIPVFLSPAQFGLPQESIYLTTSDGIGLRGWWVEGGDEAVVLCVHGYLANRCELVPYSIRFREMGASVCLIDLRCHGTSERAQVTYGLDETRDVLAALEFIHDRKPKAKIVVFASSMGAVAALRATVERPDLVQGLVLDGAYGRLDEAARGFWEVSGFKAAAKFLAPTSHFGRALLKVDPKTVVTKHLFEKAREIPMLLLYGTADTVVPVSSAQECSEAAGPKATTVWFNGCGHSAARYSDPHAYFVAIADFLDQNELIKGARENEKSRQSTIKPADSLV